MGAKLIVQMEGKKTRLLTVKVSIFVGLFVKTIRVNYGTEFDQF